MGSAEKPERVGYILKRLLKNLGIEKKVEEQEVFFSWNRIVGERLTNVSRVKNVKDGVIFVEVKGSAWMSEISLMKHLICEKLNEGKARGTIRDIVLTQWRERNEER
jgi:predicted nucleic acid-binding Zn ribbon protein